MIRVAFIHRCLMLGVISESQVKRYRPSFPALREAAAIANSWLLHRNGEIFRPLRAGAG